MRKFVLYFVYLEGQLLIPFKAFSNCV